MLRLLEQLNYTQPNLKLYNKDGCTVNFDTRTSSYRLSVDGEEWMSYRTKDHDQAYELYSHYDLAKGHCICTGLGFGVRENWLLNKKEVSKVTVIEKNKEVIDYHKYINPKFFDDVEVVHMDVYDYKGKCNTLLLDHYESEASNDMLVLQNSSQVSKNIECDIMWMWTLEHIIAGRSFQRSQDVGSYVSKVLILNEFKSRFDLPLPNLTEEELDLYYFMYNSKAISIFKHFYQEHIAYSFKK